MSIASIKARGPLPEPQSLHARTAAAQFAIRGPLRKSRFRDERALRFQQWYDASPFRLREVCPPEAWREYLRQQQHVRVHAA